MKLLREPKGIYIHHSATRDTASLSYPAIRSYHVDVNEWEEVGYHFLVELFEDKPLLLTGRGVQYEGAHAAGHNDCLGICVVGNYDLEHPDPELMKVLTRLLNGLLTIYPHLRPTDIHYHNEVSEKTCPGTLFPPVSVFQNRMFNGR